MALRVAMIAGSLTQGGAEKQLLYMARALRNAGVSVHIYCLTEGEFHEPTLRREGFEFTFVGRLAHPAARLLVLLRACRRVRPHIIQSTHFFVNLYAALLGRACHAIGVGSIRNDGRFDMQANGRWGPWLLSAPEVLLANSWAARHHAVAAGISRDRVFVLPNVIDLAEFDDVRPRTADESGSDGPTAVAVCRLVPMKRLDRFIQALALARREVPSLRGVIVGDGPERGRLEDLARATDGLAGAITFAGRSDTVPALLRRADMLVLTSDHEGFPNVVLEAMSASLPVVATPAGDVGQVVVQGQTGFVVAFDDVRAMAEHMVRLALSPELRARLGRAGRARVEGHYTPDALGDRMLELYRSMAEVRRDDRARAALTVLRA